MKALLRAEKAVSEFPFSGQTAEDARQEASVPPKVSFNAAPSLVVFFLMLAIAAGITMFTISRSLLTGWEKGSAMGDLCRDPCRRRDSLPADTKTRHKTRTERRPCETVRHCRSVRNRRTV